MSQQTEITPEQLETLKKKSKSVCELAYAPYSNFKVGAALLTTDGKYFTGCNVENAAYGPSICAERTAMVKAVSEGCKSFAAIAIYSDNVKEGFISPCGVCRQVMSEFGLKWDVYMLRQDLTHKKKTVGELLPDSFKL